MFKPKKAKVLSMLKKEISKQELPAHELINYLWSGKRF